VVRQPLYLSDRQLVTLLGWSKDEVQRRFATARVMHRRHVYIWRDVRAMLSEAQLRAAAKRAHLVRTSKEYLSGYPALVAQWDVVKNDTVLPQDMRSGSHRRIWWTCDKGPDHRWRTSPLMRTGLGTGCPFCSGARPSITNCLETLAPEVTREWHPAANRPLTPRDVTTGSGEVVTWKCPRGGHVWRATVNARAREGKGCPVCARKEVADNQARPPAGESLADLVPALVREWHPTKNGTLTPRDVFKNATRPVWWRCTVDPRHEWSRSPNGRLNRGRVNGCPRCKYRPPIEESLFQKRPDLARQWDVERNGSLSPKQVSCGSRRRVWWRCVDVPDHVWQREIWDRVRGSGCPQCRPRK
jgi:hypothetical protein